MTLTSASLNIRRLRIMLNEKGCLFCHLHISQEEVKKWVMQNWGRGQGGGGQTRCIKGEVPMANRPFPSYKYSHFQNKAYCGTFLVKMSFICIRMKNKRECSSFSLDKKTIVISMASHLASLWNIGLGRLGNRLKEQKMFNLHASRGPLHCEHQSRMVCRMGIPHGRLRLVQEFGSTLLRQKIFTY